MVTYCSGATLTLGTTNPAWADHSSSPLAMLSGVPVCVCSQKGIVKSIAMALCLWQSWSCAGQRRSRSRLVATISPQFCSFKKMKLNLLPVEMICCGAQKPEPSGMRCWRIAHHFMDISTEWTWSITLSLNDSLSNLGAWAVAAPLARVIIQLLLDGSVAVSLIPIAPCS